jgi:hypothetical protein
MERRRSHAPLERLPASLQPGFRTQLATQRSAEDALAGSRLNESHCGPRIACLDLTSLGGGAYER